MMADCLKSGQSRKFPSVENDNLVAALGLVDLGKVLAVNHVIKENMSKTSLWDEHFLRFNSTTQPRPGSK